MSGIELFIKGGPVMYLLLACLVVVIYTSFERFFYYRAQKMKESENNLQILKELLIQSRWNEIREYCKNNNTLMTRVILAGLDVFIAGKDVELALESVSIDSEMKIRSGLRYLNAVVTIAPLLGLLGTITGMIKSFSIFNIESGKPMAITGGIGEALIATATGLMVAIVSFIMYLILSHQAEKILTQLDKLSIWLLLQLNSANINKKRQESKS